MIPSKWFEIQSQFSQSQEKIAKSMSDMSENNARVAKLLESLVDATLAIHHATIVKREADGEK
jgi:hypothetical protein